MESNGPMHCLNRVLITKVPVTGGIGIYCPVCTASLDLLVDVKLQHPLGLLTRHRCITMTSASVSEQHFAISVAR